MKYFSLFIVFSVLLHRGNLHGDEGKEKRILLSDPSVIESRFLEMERKIQNFTTNQQNLEFTISNLKTQLHVMEQKNQNLQSTINSSEAHIKSLETTVNSLATQLTQHINTGTGGAIYVRWGRGDCSQNGTELVYSGYAGGSFYNEYGSAADYVCLPPDPQWGSHYDNTVNRGGHMYGAEYEDAYFGTSFTAGPDDVPCAVCRSPTRSSHIMIPGRNTCYKGWTQEYFGNLASGHRSHKSASQFVCIDENPLPVPHGGDEHDGKLFYAVEGICGSLACPPYVNGRELTCVVCTK